MSRGMQIAVAVTSGTLVVFASTAALLMADQASSDAVEAISSGLIVLGVLVVLAAGVILLKRRR
ncbi:LPXTG cell wall anchor domain-containing protein [Actinosynnema sp. NPDC050436]|uniref:LPXTG cell wall anchor domain-containing protein n=1 Tax=Actinosynnema sp. NPDC050436 TaxID=3155659 RepID=UPI0033F8251A